MIGYYPWYERYDVAPAAFPFAKLTHVDVGNVYPASPSTCCTSPDSGFDAFARDVTAKAHAAGKVALLQLGGAGGNPGNVWNQSTSTAAGTNTLADAIVAYAKARGFDGASIDWEENVEWDKVTALAKALRSRWPSAVLTIDTDPFATDTSWASAAAPYVDRINAMTYASIGNWGGWDGPWQQGPLYETADHSRSSTHPYSIDRTVQAFLDAGVPAAKLGFGIGLYGSGYGDSNGDGRCPTAPSNGWEGEWGAWVADYDLQLRAVDELYGAAMQHHWDDAAQVPYLTAPAPGVGGEADGWPPKLCYITYEDSRSATEKMRYLRQRALGGIIVWAAPQDRRADGSYPVLDALMNGR